MSRATSAGSSRGTRASASSRSALLPAGQVVDLHALEVGRDLQGGPGEPAPVAPGPGAVGGFGARREGFVGAARGVERPAPVEEEIRDHLVGTAGGDGADGADRGAEVAGRVGGREAFEGPAGGGATRRDQPLGTHELAGCEHVLGDELVGAAGPVQRRDRVGGREVQLLTAPGGDPPGEDLRHECVDEA
jgi:hypothetical protein